jgi:hypothetical protein
VRQRKIARFFSFCNVLQFSLRHRLTEERQVRPDASDSYSRNGAARLPTPLSRRHWFFLQTSVVSMPLQMSAQLHTPALTTSERLPSVMFVTGRKTVHVLVVDFVVDVVLGNALAIEDRHYDLRRLSPGSCDPSGLSRPANLVQCSVDFRPQHSGRRLQIFCPVSAIDRCFHLLKRWNRNAC